MPQLLPDRRCRTAWTELAETLAQGFGWGSLEGGGIYDNRCVASISLMSSDGEIVLAFPAVWSGGSGNGFITAAVWCVVESWRLKWKKGSRERAEPLTMSCETLKSACQTTECASLTISILPTDVDYHCRRVRIDLLYRRQSSYSLVS